MYIANSLNNMQMRAGQMPGIVVCSYIQASISSAFPFIAPLVTKVNDCTADRGYIARALQDLLIE